MAKFSRNKQNRERMLRNLATSLILHEQIITTKTKSKVVLHLVAKLLKLSKANNLAARRQSQAILFHQGAVKKLFEDINKRLLQDNFIQNIKSIPIKNRLGDNAPLNFLKLDLKPVEEIVKAEITKKPAKKQTDKEDKPADKKEKIETKE